jgi:[acyl-carrier-protein] S-malonyltransferase
MKAFLFPGQGSQFPGMGKVFKKKSNLVESLFKRADQILNFPLSEIMCNGSEEDLKKTDVTQCAIFLHSILSFKLIEDSIKPDFIAGHSLGEFSALVAAKSISFEDGLKLVHQRSISMKKACEKKPGTMAAIIGIESKLIEQLCSFEEGIVVIANYNCPGQIVISGEIKSVINLCEKLKEKGAKRTIILKVDGAFHSPLMEDAKNDFELALNKTKIETPVYPIYQNFSAKKEINSSIIRKNLSAQLTGAVRWNQSIEKMIEDGTNKFYEIGPGDVLKGLVRKINRDIIIC